MSANLSSVGTWFVRIRRDHVEWIEGPFILEQEAQEHARLLTQQGYGAPRYELRTVRLERPEAETVITRLADWIEQNCEGVKVYRDTGLVVS